MDRDYYWESKYDELRENLNKAIAEIDKKSNDIGYGIEWCAGLRVGGIILRKYNLIEGDNK